MSLSMKREIGLIPQAELDGAGWLPEHSLY
jgi:hypothetical protein